MSVGRWWGTEGNPLERQAPRIPCSRCGRFLPWPEAVVGDVGEGQGYGHAECDPADVAWKRAMLSLVQPRRRDHDDWRWL
jgi:predicted amidohydrolase